MGKIVLLNNRPYMFPKQQFVKEFIKHSKSKLIGSKLEYKLEIRGYKIIKWGKFNNWGLHEQK